MIKMKDKAIENLEFSLRDRDTLVYNLNNKENQITKLEIKGKELTESLRQNSLQLEQLLIEKENNQKKIKTLENNLNEVSDYNLYKQENIKLQEKLNNTDHNLVVLEKSLNEKEDDIKILTSQNRELQKQNTKFNEMILSYQADINQLKNIQKTKENLEFELINKEKEIKRLQDSEAANNKLNEILDAKENEKICLINIHQQETQKLSLKIDELEAENKKNSNLNSQLRVKEKELCNIKNINNSLLEQIVQKEEKNNALAKEYEKKTQVIELQNKKYSEELNNLKAIKKKLSENELELEDSKEAYEKKINKLSNELLDAKDRIASILSEYDESIIADKEEISRLNNEILKQITLSENQKKEIALLSQRILASESALQRCQNCKDFQSTIEAQKEKISELECFIHLAEESLGGFFCNSLVESISALVSSKTQGIKRAPRPPLLRGKPEMQRRPLDHKNSVVEELGAKSPMLSDSSKRSQGSAYSLPEGLDLRNELIEEKNESERYLIQIKLLKEDIRELERKLKRNQDVNDKTNAEILKSTLIKMVRSLPIQNNEVEGMISLVFSIISVPKEEMLKLEPERRSKNSKRFGVF